MIGFHDHIHSPGSGRPEPHHSWAAERFATWTSWFMAAVCVIGAGFFYAKWEEAAGALTMLLLGLLSATLAYLRRKALGRKRVALKEAIVRYERMVSEPFP